MIAILIVLNLIAFAVIVGWILGKIGQNLDVIDECRRQAKTMGVELPSTPELAVRHVVRYYDPVWGEVEENE